MGTLDVEEIVEELSNIVGKNKHTAIPPQWKDWLRTTLEEKDKECEERVRKERKMSVQLWDILDSIDSLPDMIHPNTPEGYEKCWRMMVKRAEERHKVLSTDGYTLTPTKTDKQ